MMIKISPKQKFYIALLLFTCGLNMSAHYLFPITQILSWAELMMTYPNEWTDTTICRPRPDNLTIEWIFKEIASVERVGREHIMQEEDPYYQKSYPEYKVPEQIQKFIKGLPIDTVFIVEKMSREGDFPLLLWRRTDSIIEQNFTHVRIRTDIQRYRGSFSEYTYISRWDKNKLQTYGSFSGKRRWINSNPSTVCATRVIIRSDSVRFDMFKYYDLLLPEEEWL